MGKEIDAIIQTKYAESLKQAKACLKKGQLDEATEIMTQFFDYNQEELGEYFGSKSVEEVSKEMLDRMEQAQATLAPVLAANPEKARQFMGNLKAMVDREFDAFREMHSASN